MRAYPDSDGVTLISQDGLEHDALARWSRMTPTIHAVAHGTYGRGVVIRFVDADGKPPAPDEEVPGPAGGPPEIKDDDRPLPTAEVCRLVGATEDELDDAIENGRFPLPDGYVSLRPYWDRETIGQWVKMRDMVPEDPRTAMPSWRH